MPTGLHRSLDTPICRYRLFVTLWPLFLVACVLVLRFDFSHIRLLSMPLSTVVLCRVGKIFFFATRMQIKLKSRPPAIIYSKFRPLSSSSLLSASKWHHVTVGASSYSRLSCRHTAPRCPLYPLKWAFCSRRSNETSFLIKINGPSEVIHGHGLGSLLSTGVSSASVVC